MAEIVKQIERISLQMRAVQKAIVLRFKDINKPTSVNAMNFLVKKSYENVGYLNIWMC
jgi:hypothetical protein